MMFDMRVLFTFLLRVCDLLREIVAHISLLAVNKYKVYSAILAHITMCVGGVCAQ